MDADKYNADKFQVSFVSGEKVLDHCLSSHYIQGELTRPIRAQGETYQKMQRNDDLNRAEIVKARSARIEALLLGSARGGQKDFKMLVEDCSATIHGVLVAMLRDREQARDALQVVFVRIWQRATTYDPARGTAEGWMIGIARNHAIDLLRVRKRRAETQPEDHHDLADTALTAERRLIVRDDVRKMLDCLDKMEPKKAGAVRMAYLQGLSYADLADRTGIPLNTVRTWLRRGLAALKDCVDG